MPIGASTPTPPPSAAVSFISNRNVTSYSNCHQERPIPLPPYPKSGTTPLPYQANISNPASFKRCIFSRAPPSSTAEKFCTSTRRASSKMFLDAFFDLDFIF